MPKTRVYGHVRPSSVIKTPGILKSGEVFKSNGGAFVTVAPADAATGKLTICTASSQTIVGWAEMGTETLTADKVANIITDGIFRIPIASGTYTDALKQKVFDVAVASNIQGIALDASTHDLLRVVDGNNSEGWIEVEINNAERYIA